MGKFNGYGKKLNAIAQAAFAEMQEKTAAYRDAEAVWNRLKSTTQRTTQDKIRAAKAEAAYLETRDSYMEMQRNLSYNTMKELNALRGELAQAIDNEYSADPTQLDTAALELLKSDILKPREYIKLMESAISTGNTTMARLIGQ